MLVAGRWSFGKSLGEYMEFEIWDEDPRFLGPGLLTSSDDKKPECSEFSFFCVIPHLF